MSLVRKVYKKWMTADIQAACRLALVTDDRWLGERTLHACVAEAIMGGVTMVKLRNKGASTRDLVRRARNLAPVCHVANVPLIVDSDFEAAKVAGADGVHLERGDVSCAKARSEMGYDAIIGVSVVTPEEAVEAQAQGASYLAVGPMFASAPGNVEQQTVPIAVLHEIAKFVDVPVVAIGGINTGNIMDLAKTGIMGVAAASAILAAPDIEAAAANMMAEVNAYLNSSPCI